ncbi:MAG TPA: hypothetical protein VHB21_08855 [Minicystis sp.]|nr:hypothetical protein [Minicystis sp.]
MTPDLIARRVEAAARGLLETDEADADGRCRQLDAVIVALEEALEEVRAHRAFVWAAGEEKRERAAQRSREQHARAAQASSEGEAPRVQVKVRPTLGLRRRTA